jgi:hypothetical protein
MNLMQWLSLLWRNFSPLEERLFAAVRPVLPAAAQSILDIQVAAVTRIQRHPHWTEICYYRMRRGKVDWGDVPLFPCTDEVRLAEVRFTVSGHRFKATFTAIGGHIFDFAITPNPRSIAFADWDEPVRSLLLDDPMRAPQGSRRPEKISGAWRRYLETQVQRNRPAKPLCPQQRWTAWIVSEG